MKNSLQKIFLALLCLSVFFNSSQAQNALSQTKAEINKLIATSGAETVAVAVYDLRSKQALLINERETFHAASTMKLPVMMELFRLAEQKKFKLDDELIIKNNFASIADGSAYTLSPTDDSDAEIYEKIGQPLTIRTLMERMITRSSNLATNILIEKAGAQNVMQLMKNLGAHDMQVRRGVEDNKAFRAGLNNTTTAQDLMILLRALIEKKFLTVTARQEMIAILSNQEFNEGIPAQLPAGTKVAHKTGSITKINHDAGIVFPQKSQPYIIVVLTRGLADEKQAHNLIATISAQIFQSIVKKH